MGCLEKSVNGDDWLGRAKWGCMGVYLGCESLGIVSLALSFEACGRIETVQKDRRRARKEEADRSARKTKDFLRWVMANNSQSSIKWASTPHP